MSDRVLIPLPGIGTLELPREVYEAALRPILAPQLAAASPPSSSATELVTAKVLAARLSLPLSSIYEYARAGKIPCSRARDSKRVLFDPAAVLQALRVTSKGTGGHA